MAEVVAHVVAAERQHRHWIAPHHAHRARGGRGGLRCHGSADVYTVLPVKALIHQGRDPGPATTKDDGRNRNPLRVLPMRRDAGAAAGGDGEPGVGVGSVSLLTRGKGVSLPIQSARGHGKINAFPPGLVLRCESHVGEDGIALHGGHHVGVGVVAGSRDHPKEPILRVAGPQPSVGADAHPRNVIAHGPNPIPLRGQRRDEHCQVGLSTCAGEGRGHVTDVA